MRVIRVFPTATKATPDDALAYTGPPDLFAEADRVEISVAFTWDLPRAHELAKAWERVAPVTMGGPAMLCDSTYAPGEFTAGKYLRHGYTITSRGCPNCCWFCKAWLHYELTELPIQSGWIVQDDNLLACSERHVRAVFDMLSGFPRRVSFAGGLEAARLQDWHVELLAQLRPRPSVFFSFDEEEGWEPLVVASGKLWEAGFSRRSHLVRCYVLIGFPGDRTSAAEQRLQRVKQLGLTPAAMLYRADDGNVPDVEWRRLQRRWMRPAIIHARQDAKEVTR